jgi:glucosamine 6-phosphate synthetase-like amidotransferase/phosphosugar isomerase protein
VINETFLIALWGLRLLAYHIGVRRGYDVDEPRNLAENILE